jgi:hypothetical protein
MLLTLLIVAVPAKAADRLTLTNGDVLSGEMKSASDTEVVFASDLAGTVTVKRASVAQLVRSGSDGRSETLTAAQLQKTAAAAGERAPSWNGAANGDVAVSRGNSDTATVSINTNVTRLSDESKLATYGNYLLSSVGSGTGTTLARAARAGARFDRNIAKPLFGFAFGDAEHDFLQLLDLRTVVGGGLGVHVANSARVQANVFGGLSYAHDSYAAPIATTDTTTTTTTTTTGTTTTTTTTPGPGNSASTNAAANANGKAVAVGKNRTIIVEARTPPAVVNPTLSRAVGEYVFGQDVVAQLGGGMTLTQRLVVFPAIKDPGDYRVSFDLSLSGQMTQHWQWHTTVSDRYLRIPPSGGAVRNDMFVATGLGVTFGQGDIGGYRGADTRGR